MLMRSRQERVWGLERSSGPLPVTLTPYLGLWVLEVGIAAESFLGREEKVLPVAERGKGNCVPQGLGRGILRTPSATL